MSLRQKTFTGFIWSFIDNFARHGITFIVGIVLARLLEPRDFGIIAMTTFFIAISQTFIDGGFTNSLIRKKKCSQADYSTVFYFNLVIGALFYLLLFFTADLISNVLNEPQLKLIIQVLCISLIINSLSLIQRTKLTKQINFKLQTRISIIASVLSGIIGLGFAYAGYGVWSLVFKTLSGFTIMCILFWLWGNWKPSFLFSLESFNEMFSFGSKLLLTRLINTVFKNVYYLVIGKYFSSSDLGYYSRASQFQELPSKNLNILVERVCYPVLSELQDDTKRLSDAYQKLIKSTMLITFLVRMGLAAVAKPMILLLIGQKWLTSAIYLQLLCFVGMFYPLQVLNSNILKVRGRAASILRIEIINKVLTIPTIIVGVYYGIELMIVGMILNAIAGFVLYSYCAGTLVAYNLWQQVKDILPSFILALFVGSIVFLIGILMNTMPIIVLAIQIIAGIVITILICELLKLNDYQYLKKLAIEQIRINRK